MVTFTPLKEEASTEFTLIRENLGYYIGDYRLTNAYYII